MRLLVVFGAAFVFVCAAGAALRAPVPVTLDGVAGVRPGMSVAAVSARWDMRLKPSYEVRPDCGQALFDGLRIKGYAIFMPRGRFGAVFFRKGAVSGKGIRIGSTLAQLRRVYSNLRSRPDRYVPGGRQYFVRRARAPYWQLRFDVTPERRVTQIVFGNRESTLLDEACA